MYHLDQPRAAENFFWVQLLVDNEDLFEIVLVESDGEHDEDPGEHAEDLQDDGKPVRLLLLVGGYWMRVAWWELRHHVHQSHIQEDPCK